MEQGHPLAEPRDKPGYHLRREHDLRHEHDHAGAARERFGGDAHVHLGLPARGHAMQQEAAPGAERSDDRCDRFGLRSCRGDIAHAVVLGERELGGNAAHRASTLDGQPPARECAGGVERPADLRELPSRARPAGERAQRDQLASAETRAPVERGSSRGSDREDRLGALPARRAELAAARARRERGRKHGADRVGEAAAIALSDPCRERKLMSAQQRERMHQRIYRPKLAGRHTVERDHDAGHRTLSEADANEVAWQKVELVRHEIAECPRRPAQAREDGDLGGPGGHRS